MENPSNDLKKWVSGWMQAETELAEFNRHEMRSSDTYRSMLALSDAFEAALPFRASAPITGLVEQQRIFALWKSK